MKIADIIEAWFQANFCNNTYYQREQLFAQAQAAKADLLQRLESAAQAEAQKIVTDFQEPKKGSSKQPEAGSSKQ